MRRARPPSPAVPALPTAHHTLRGLAETHNRRPVRVGPRGTPVVIRAAVPGCDVVLTLRRRCPAARGAAAGGAAAARTGTRTGAAVRPGAVRRPLGAGRPGGALRTRAALGRARRLTTRSAGRRLARRTLRAAAATDGLL